MQTEIVDHAFKVTTGQGSMNADTEVTLEPIGKSPAIVIDGESSHVI